MTRQEAIEILESLVGMLDISNCDADTALKMAIYDMGIVKELRKERDAALDTAFAALKMREDRKDG